MIYLLHFDQPYKHARHYLGYCADGRLEERLKEHATNGHVRILNVLKAAGITWRLAITFPGDRIEERRLKNTGSGARYCPICHTKPWKPKPWRKHESID